MHAALQQQAVTMAPLPVVAAQFLRQMDRPLVAQTKPAQPCAVFMSDATPREFVVQGLTAQGRPFRPSDWAERLAGALSSFRPRNAHSGAGAHIGYSPYCVPRVIDNIKCVIVSEALRELEPMAWDFVMSFARDNELRIVESPLADGPPTP